MRTGSSSGRFQLSRAPIVGRHLRDDVQRRHEVARPDFFRRKRLRQRRFGGCVSCIGSCLWEDAMYVDSAARRMVRVLLRCSARTMNDEATYICGACGEEIVIPIDLSQGERQEYVEDCPVCCQANVIVVEIDDDGEARRGPNWNSRESSSCATLVKPRRFPISLGASSPTPPRRNSPMPRRTAVDPISALRHGGFLIYLIGGLISNSGSQMRIVAVQWEITIREPDPRKLALYLGYIGLALVLPVILFALPAGAAADRFSRRWLIVIAQARTGRVRRRPGLGVVGEGADAAHLFAAVRHGNVFARLGWPASSAIVTGLVPSKMFSNAATWRSNAYQLASTIGPLAGGFLLAWWNPVIVFLIDAASSVVLADVHAVRAGREPQERVVEPKIVAQRDARHSLSAPPADHPLDDDARHGGRAVRRRGRAAADFRDAGFQRRTRSAWAGCGRCPRSARS